MDRDPFLVDINEANYETPKKLEQRIKGAFHRDTKLGGQMNIRYAFSTSVNSLEERGCPYRLLS